MAGLERARQCLDMRLASPRPLESSTPVPIRRRVGRGARRAKRLTASLFLVLAVGPIGCAGLPISDPSNTSNPSNTSLVAPGASVVKLADGFLFTEGPAADAEGNVYFSDIPNDRIHRYDLEGTLSVFLEGGGAGGSNGLFFDAEGQLLACQMQARRVVSIGPDGAIRVVADAYAGRPLNQTNDLWVDPEGGVYFTDPYYGEEADALEQGGFHVYYVPPTRDRVVRVIDDLPQPNGLVGTSDGRTLYVSDPGSRKTWAYSIQSDGRLTDRRQAAPEGYDGLTLDEHGNLYVAHEGVEIYAPDGTWLETVEMPEHPANLTFGGADGRTLFLTARTGFYSIRMKVRGQPRPAR